jgi:peptide/nickel transport system permease protein
VLADPVPGAGGARATPEKAAAAAPASRLRVVARLIAVYLFTLWALATLLFLIPRAIPGDPLAVLADSGGLPPDARRLFMSHYGLDRSLVHQYGHYLAGLARGDFGVSIANQVPVSFLLRANLPWTLLLVGTSLLLSSVLSFRAGISAAWRRGEARDRALLVASTGLHALPDYALATFLLIAFALVLRVFPIAGANTPFSTGRPIAWRAADVVRHLILPCASLTLGLMGTKFLLVRNVTIGVLGQDYMVLARAKGLPERMLKYHHAGRNTLLPFLSLVGVQAGVAVGGAIFVETVFAYPGFGNLMVGAVNTLDYPVIEACFVVLALIVLTANLVVDLVSSFLDPRLGAE